MPRTNILKSRVQELMNREWDLPGIKSRIEKLSKNGIPKRGLDPREIVSGKSRILDRVQRRAEEYEYLSHSCSKGSALSLMEEFGLGNMEIVKAMSPFPGFAMTGWICGGITGSLVALGLFFGSDDLLDYTGTGRTMAAARKFIPRFEQEVGALLCPKIHEEVVFGKYINARESREKFEEFVAAKGYERCALLPGIGARIAAEIIIDSLEESGRR
jgi:C_GCAxxG_C_C family probable redox protein